MEPIVVRDVSRLLEAMHDATIVSRFSSIFRATPEMESSGSRREDDLEFLLTAHSYILWLHNSVQ